jgi:antitoxin (DNA-binding transcriptional repressor) of toxin-antitoxin stability system
MTIIGLKELRQNASQIAERALKGEYFTVVKRSKPVFEISPPAASHKKSDQELREWTQQAIERYRPALDELSKK